MPTWELDVVVMPKPGVNDPEGEAILGGLRSLGYQGVERVRAGRSIRLQITAETAEAAGKIAAEMADRLLANPVIEVYRVSPPERAQAGATP